MFRTCSSLGARAPVVAFILVCMCGSRAALADGATRDLPDEWAPGVPLVVAISLDPPGGTIAVGVEDEPPPGWTSIANISDGGFYDSANHKVKWGPFFDPSIPATISYEITPPVDATGTPCFNGTVSINGINEPIMGDQCLPDLAVPTVSEWGMLAMGLLVVAAGTCIAARRRQLPIERDTA